MNSERSFTNPLVPLIRRSMFWRPNFHQGKGWLEFVPVGFWLVDVLRPARVLEVGTTSGNSYFSLCQSINSLGIDCESISIVSDKESGDAANANALIQRHNSYNYAGFSKILSSGSLDISTLVEDNSTDLLLINEIGDVRLSDFFAVALRKLSSRGVVVLNYEVLNRHPVRNEFLNYIRENFQNFELTHGSGLLIIQCGTKPAPIMMKLMECAASTSHRQTVREVFSSLGQACVDAYSVSSIATGGGIAAVNDEAVSVDHSGLENGSDNRQVLTGTSVSNAAGSTSAHDTAVVGESDLLQDRLEEFLDRYEALSPDGARFLDSDSALEELARSESSLLKRLSNILLKNRADFSDMQVEIQHLGELSKSSKDELTERDGQVEHLREALFFRDKELSQLKSVASKAQADVSRLEFSLKERFDEIAKITSIAEEHRKALQDAKKAADISEQALKKQKASEAQKLKVQNSMISSLETKVKEQKSNAAKLDAERNALQRETEALKVDLKRAEQNFTAVTEINRKFEEEIKSLKDSSVVLDKKYKESVSKRDGEIKKLTAEITDINRKLKQAQSNAKLLSSERERSSALMNKLDEEVEKVRDRDEQIKILTGLVYPVSEGRENEPLEERKKNKYERKAKLPLFGFMKGQRGGNSETKVLPQAKQIEAIKRSGLFDNTWYLNAYPDVKTAGIDPVVHYVKHGASEGRNPAPSFSTLKYMNAHPNLEDSGINAFFHAIESGKVK